MSCRLSIFVGHRSASACLAVILVLAALVSVPVNAAPISVRFPEGVTHGFLLVRSLAGEILGQGEMTQVVKEGDLVESQLVFRFKDGSLHDEKVAFSQQRVFTMISYRLVQSGPSFPDQIEISVDRGTAEYTVRSKKPGEDGKAEVLSGQVDLPKDVYNGMLITVSKNLQKGADETVSVLAFTPAPQVVKVQLRAIDEHPVQIGEAATKATQYVFTPQIGMIRELFGKAIGKIPAEFHYTCWILVDEAPSFVQFEGPLQLMAPIVRIELVSPRLPAKPEDKKVSSK
ncbi:MAG TPA: hypothetical protein VES92_12840 [Nitrospiraceae bacterium]|nr:hypothetical protein [Nitrospiraceae bacterium]